MRTYTITGPDGKDYSIDGPEGATRDQVIAKIKERLGNVEKKQATQQPEQDIYTKQAGKQSIIENLLAGAGGGVYGMLLGAKQLLGKAKPGEIEEHKKAMAGLRSTTAGTIGDIGGQVAAAVPMSMIPGANTYAGAGVLGSVMGALQPTEREGERGNNMVLGGLGGVAGNAAARGLTRLIQPIPRLPSQGKDIGTAAAQRLNYPLTAGDRTGSVGLQQVEDLLSRTPGSAGAMRKLYDTKQLAINQAAAKSIGETADDISEGTFAAAKARLGGEFNKLSQNAQVQIGDEFKNALTKISSGNEQLGAFRNTEIDKLVTQGLDLAKQGKLEGKAYQLIRSKLTDRASDAFKSSNSELGQALKTIRDALDDSARNGMDDATKQAWDTVRKQYSNLKILEKGNVVNSGNVNPALVKNALQQYNAGMHKSGALNGELMDISRIAQNFKIPSQGSQTYERGALSNMMFGNPITGLPLVAGSRAMQAALMNKPMQEYLVKGMAKLPPEIQLMLLRAGTAGGGVAGANAGN